MSEAGGRKMRLVAMGAALVALAFTLVAVIVVLTRGNGDTAPAKADEQVANRDVKATDVVKVRRDDVVLVVEKGVTKGVRLKDAELAKSLGLEPDDVITALSGKPMTRESDAYDAILKLGLMSATTMYVEISRKDKPMLLRWRLDGDLRQARYSSPSSSNLFGSVPYTPPSTYTPPSYPSYGTPAPADDDLALLIDTIEKVDDSHYKIPRKVVDAVLANPMAIAKGARVVPAMKNGDPDGFKLYAIRPSSVYAKLGLNNGDTIHAVNGFELTSADKALEVYTKLRDATELTFELTRRGHPVTITYEIGK